MNLLSLDPGPTSSGYARVRLVGPRVTYVSSGRVSSDLNQLERLFDPELDAVAVETPKGYVFSPARGAQLLATARIAGALAWMAQARHLRLVELSAGEWRKALCGRATADDHRVADAVAANVIDCPAKSNVHVRDALGLALVAAWQLAGSLGRRAG